MKKYEFISFSYPDYSRQYKIAKIHAGLIQNFVEK